MSYDRYLAICNPLRYTAIMSHKFCFNLVIMSWVISYAVLLNEAIALFKLWFCGPHVIDHFFCDFTPLLELSCSDTYVTDLVPKLLTIPLVIVPFLIIIISYVYIVFTILKIPSLTGRHKAFSTCSSHLAVVFLFYGSLTSIYSLPTKANSKSLSKLLSLLYTVVTPMINPVIYSFRNKDIHKAFDKYIKTASDIQKSSQQRMNVLLNLGVDDVQGQVHEAIKTPSSTYICFIIQKAQLHEVS
ncbi:olfactory receptor 1468-like [Pseudophryne corroboree]|uniref:olfactory receptor 1468-like n=1 Tax=Pseudophryne corroboree TaxID=495146 RepID=UPI0030816DE5